MRYRLFVIDIGVGTFDLLYTVLYFDDHHPSVIPVGVTEEVTVV